MSDDENANPNSGSGVGAPLRTILGLFFLFLVIGMCLPRLSTPRAHTEKSFCQSNMRNAVLAILNYEALNQAYPQAVSYDATGPGTVFSSDKRISGSDIKDGTHNTIMMIEIMDSDITWTEPRDLTIDEAIALFNRPESVRKKHPTNHHGGRMVAFADGHIDFAPEDTPPEVLQALFTIDGGEAVSLNSH